MDAAIDGQNQAEIAVVGKGTRSRDPEAVVEKDMLPLDKSCSGIPADGEIQRVGNDFVEAPHEVFVLCFISHVLGFSAEGAEKFSFLKCISRCPRLQPVFGQCEGCVCLIVISGCRIIAFPMNCIAFLYRGSFINEGISLL